MNWYSASLFFRTADMGDGELWEESVVLIEADSPEVAAQLGTEIGAAGEHSYLNSDGDLVEWKFERVERIFVILEDQLETGTEVFSRFLKASEAGSLLSDSLED